MRPCETEPSQQRSLKVMPRNPYDELARVPAFEVGSTEVKDGERFRLRSAAGSSVLAARTSLHS